MQPHHLSGVLRIEEASFSSPWSRTSFLKELESSFVSSAIVAQRGGTVMGYIVAWFILDEAHIGNVAVDPKARRQGIGRMMMEWLLRQAARRGCAFATLEVRASNRAAQRLYESLGFDVLGRRPAYYMNPKEDAVVMGKNI